MLETGKLHRLSFSMQLSNIQSKELRLGNLAYFQAGKEIYRWIVTSGQRGYQYSGSTSIKGKGPIPSCQYAQIPCYEVQPEKIFMPQVKGVEGSFYRIFPFLVSLKGVSYQRGDFGIHFDANVPGSSGCIVFRKQSDWDSFRYLMGQLALQKIDRIRLDVSYS